jgi:RarD protein
MKKKESSLRMLIASMVIFGTIGVFRRYIPLPSASIAALRGIVGAAFLLALTAIRRKKPDRAAIRGNLALLLISGAVMGVNWIALFEAYRFTSVAVATLCYYMAPVFVILVSPVLLGEKLTARKGLCVAAALLGMVLVSGVLEGGAVGSVRGVLLGRAAAALYAAVILMNKKMKPMPGMDRSVVQLFAAGIVVLPYALLTGFRGSEALTLRTALLLAVICLVHTGLAYVLYFGSMEDLPAHTIALLGYIDPVVAVLLSALLLHEALTPLILLGAVLIIGAAILGELPGKKKA